MKPFIRMTRLPYQEAHQVHLVVVASNGRQMGEIEVYSNAEGLAALASKVRGFPKEEGDTVSWELGSERPEDHFAFYLRLRVFQVAASGRCGIELRLCNHREPPDRAFVEFSIEALPSDLDRLADLLERFSREELRVLEWNVDDGELS
ncbi:MAG TPA: hypothetical protein VFW45_10920 [Candidatus Polarisedimenticolia bacterium]|nr:hypothetical protein [Candidatus Polarisedimenticolia bacterium]